MNLALPPRVGGVACVVSGLLLVPSPLGFFLPALVRSPGDLDQATFLSVAAALLLVPVGLLGFHGIRGHRYGWLGVVGMLSTAAASVAVALGLADRLVWGDVLQDMPPAWLGLGSLCLLAGSAGYGVATLRVLPTWCGVAFIAALPAALAAGVVGSSSPS